MPSAAVCSVCGTDCGLGVPRVSKHMAIDQHDPRPAEPVTTPSQLGYPRGIYLTVDGRLQDGSQDGALAYGAHDPIPMSRAQELGLIRAPAPARERRR